MTDDRRERAARPVGSARGEILYERYKEALRRGHVAAMRGDLDEALAAYQEASRIAPTRPVARASAGMALARAGRVSEALAHYDAAVRLAPHDEPSRAGRAEALAALGRKADAAEDLDVVVDVRERAGRVTEALDAATRALGLAEARHRRRAVERFVAALESSELDEPARDALTGALQVLDGGVSPMDSGVAANDADGAGSSERSLHDPAGGPERGPTQAGDAAAERGPNPLAETVGEAPPAAEPPEGPAALQASSEAGEAGDAADAVQAAEAALDAGDAPTARMRLLALADAHGAAGRIDAALDACYLALSVAPDDLELHLALVGLYEQRGWAPVAIEKLDLLARLAALDGDPQAGERIAAARTRLG